MAVSGQRQCKSDGLNFGQLLRQLSALHIERPHFCAIVSKQFGVVESGSDTLLNCRQVFTERAPVRQQVKSDDISWVTECRTPERSIKRKYVCLVAVAGCPACRQFSDELTEPARPTLG